MDTEPDPDRPTGRLVEADGLRWHVEATAADADLPVLLLLHGTGASTHSWRRLAPFLKPHFRIVAPDFPGHGSTEAPPRRLLSLPGMAGGVAALLRALDLAPDLVIGHSAGAAVMIRMALDGALPRARALVSLNGALVPFNQMTTRLFSPLAKALFVNPFASYLFAWQAGNAFTVERLIRGTGSTLDAEGVESYRRLVADPKHVEAALGMMANWDLATLYGDLPRLDRPLLLVSASHDRAIPAEQAFTVRDRVPHASAEVLRGLGHLAHEERPSVVASLVLDFAFRHRITAGKSAPA